MENEGQLESPAPLESYAEPAPAPAPAPTRAYPQLYKFLWGGIIVLVGSLLPFGPAIVSSMYGDDFFATDAAGASDRAAGLRALAESLGQGATSAPAAAAADLPYPMPATYAFKTFLGALFLLFGLMLIGQMNTAIRERKVALGSVLLMFIPCGWAWYKLITISGSIAGFSWAGAYKVSELEKLTLAVGSGFLLVLVGSTWVVLHFFLALFGAAKGGKKEAAPAPAGARGARPRRR